VGNWTGTIWLWHSGDGQYRPHPIDI
jgi:hypothetical protein